MDLQHLAIIMDGNRRWASENNMSVNEGHRKGAHNLWEIIKKSSELNIKYLTVFGFSTENWKRSKIELNFLLSLLDDFLEDAKSKIKNYDFHIRFIGDLSVYEKKIQDKMFEIDKVTNQNVGTTITIALNYGGRFDILYTLNNFINLKKENQSLALNEINFKSFSLNKDIPDPDMLIRTGGEKRLSNFLLWDLAYTELFFVPHMWPEFTGFLLEKYVSDFFKRKRKYGE
jgi:undecaprenyl diphosphate synthase